MITITRRQARRLHGVLRRRILRINRRDAAPPLVLHARGTGLRACCHTAALAVEFVDSLALDADESIGLPLDSLAEFAGGDDSPVVLEALAADRTRVRWTDRGVPQSRAFVVPPLDGAAPSLELPDAWTTLPGDFLATLAEASATAAEDSTRYALSCIQLDGRTGAVSATDGRQLLIQGGFRFPWIDAVLVRRAPLFACPALPRDRPVEVGRAGGRLVLRCGPWTLHLEIQTEGRYPDLAGVVPDAAAVLTRLTLDPGDARFLDRAIERLPGADDPHAPAMLDLNGKTAVRARGIDQAGATELVLARSTYSGPPVRFNTDRSFLLRALRLGFSEVGIVDAASPAVCRDRDLVYCWQPLSKDEAFDQDHAAAVESVSSIEPSTVDSDAPTNRTTPMIRTIASITPDRAIHAAATASPPTVGLPALIREVEALHQTLTDSRKRAAQLATSLRRHRRRERLVDATLASLRALKLKDVVR